MASGTLIFRPNADISNNHNESSGSVGYSLIADATADDDSTYIYQTLSSTSSTSVTSVFTLGVVGSLPQSYINITAARLYSRARIGNNDESGSYTCYFAASTTAGGSSSSASTSGSLGSNYSTAHSTSSSLVTDINSLITKDDFPVISVKVTTTGTKSSGKNASNGFIRVTQVYLELDYEEEEYVPDIPDIPSEDPTKTYHSITVSSINATTDPANGTIRVVEGTDQTITIYPTDPVLTLALDNGVDITGQLGGSGIPDNSYDVGQRSGASYGFVKTGDYYVSQNKGKSASAALCRVNFDFETEALVTIKYIVYTSDDESRYDYAVFGKIDTSLLTSNSEDNSNNVYHNGRGESSTAEQTLTYTIPAGTHYIDIKYRKDSSYDYGNDTLQFRIDSIESTSGGGEFTYTLSDVSKRHSLTFVFGSVDYYFVSSSGGNGCRVFPDGQQVKLANDSYSVTVVPDNINDSVVLFDNNVDRTSELIRTDTTDKESNPVVVYTYELSDIVTDHTITAGCSSTSTSKIFIKVNGTWSQYSKIYVKIDGAWVEQNSMIWSALFDTSESYKHG